MTYHDDIITIKLCRGELAASLGEHGRMVMNWPRFKKALEAELRRETSGHSDGHTGSSQVGDILIERIIDRYDYVGSGIAVRPDSGKNECWPFGQKWFDGEGRE
jgi:hypothetical protein